MTSLPSGFLPDGSPSWLSLFMLLACGLLFKNAIDRPVMMNASIMLY
ncbi:TPA: GlyGly-CTERM sorting domain-containing protein [Enterobacter asburiae]|nr:GlyGly-CTERM sorting domain-containing protein [Enterobacter asburiae]POV40253.1 GlyGly-CTERM sorting domain-containing protein [Enterobacter cloacae complex sp. ECNIH11]POV42362.1 GlyGly-CTERM sorting domain-containing protein [Enterobacter cloacae complex sp. ECNIH16]HBM7601393.1 GlyGly-CTERM sorting domain-containing protein [Enterobacter asburiae]HBM7610368.1 GlyGly-CTERM sorting domain-containing protein [Enterobacter asburiae]